jgi:hypothetical protein
VIEYYNKSLWGAGLMCQSQSQSQSQWDWGPIDSDSSVMIAAPPPLL